MARNDYAIQRTLTMLSSCLKFYNLCKCAQVGGTYQGQMWNIAKSQIKCHSCRAKRSWGLMEVKLLGQGEGQRRQCLGLAEPWPGHSDWLASTRDRSAWVLFTPQRIPHNERVVGQYWFFFLQWQTLMVISAFTKSIYLHIRTLFFYVSCKLCTLMTRWQCHFF